MHNIVMVIKIIYILIAKVQGYLTVNILFFFLNNLIEQKQIKKKRNLDLLIIGQTKIN